PAVYYWRLAVACAGKPGCRVPFMLIRPLALAAVILAAVALLASFAWEPASTTQAQRPPAKRPAGSDHAGAAGGAAFAAAWDHALRQAADRIAPYVVMLGVARSADEDFGSGPPAWS